MKSTGIHVRYAVWIMPDLKHSVKYLIRQISHNRADPACKCREIDKDYRLLYRMRVYHKRIAIFLQTVYAHKFFRK